ncbi:MAG TPA: hypothetical protein VN693_08415 [Rhodanobacteraceae bacterium]|nr:hypothetical protein [Rhodanobacteraceae bacterium]
MRDRKRPDQVYLAPLAIRAAETAAIATCSSGPTVETGEPMSKKGERIVSLRFAICLATLALAGCGTESFVTPTRDGAFEVTGSSMNSSGGAKEKAHLVERAGAYCERRGKIAVVVASSENDAQPGTLAAPGKLARATVEFRCE